MKTNGRYIYDGSLRVSYNKLWKLLIDKNMSCYQLGRAATIANGTFAKMKKNETVSMDTLLKICETLDCEFSDIVEILRTEK
jgi:DNA-binding Xre family transcriptional regulator